MSARHFEGERRPSPRGEFSPPYSYPPIAFQASGRSVLPASTPIAVPIPMLFPLFAPILEALPREPCKANASSHGSRRYFQNEPRRRVTSDRLASIPLSSGELSAIPSPSGPDNPPNLYGLEFRISPGGLLASFSEVKQQRTRLGCKNTGTVQIATIQSFMCSSDVSRNLIRSL